MTVANGLRLLELAPIVDMMTTKETANGVSHGLAEVGYDIRIKQNVSFYAERDGRWVYRTDDNDFEQVLNRGRFCLASAMEEFRMPHNLMGIVHDKSSWARRGLSVFNTVIEPGWCGFLTLELVHHGEEDLFIPAGSGIAQVVFHELAKKAEYSGKYQHQADRPVPAL